MNPTSTRRIVAAGTIGNLLEWYDFAIYGYFAATIGRVFFPAENPVAQVLAAFGIFALGYPMPPLGGIGAGHIGGRLGRRAALTFSIAAMALPTFLVGLLPEQKRLVAIVLSASLAIGAWFAMAAMLYEPWPVGVYAWIEKLFLIGTSAFTLSQIIHGAKKLPSTEDEVLEQALAIVDAADIPVCEQ